VGPDIGNSTFPYRGKGGGVDWGRKAKFISVKGEPAISVTDIGTSKKKGLRWGRRRTISFPIKRKEHVLRDERKLSKRKSTVKDGGPRADEQKPSEEKLSRLLTGKIVLLLKGRRGLARPGGGLRGKGEKEERTSRDRAVPFCTTAGIGGPILIQEEEKLS